jgi:hypothetical protein
VLKSLRSVNLATEEKFSMIPYGFTRDLQVPTKDPVTSVRACFALRAKTKFMFCRLQYNSTRWWLEVDI